MRKITGYLYKNNNFLIIKTFKITYIEYKNNSYTNTIPLPTEFKKLIFLMKNISNEYQKVKLSMSFIINKNGLFIKPIKNLNPNFNKLLIRFENEENYNFHSLDLTNKKFNKLFDINNIKINIDFKKIKDKKFIKFDKIIKLENKISKNLNKILPVFLKNYINLKDKLKQNIRPSTNVLTIIKTIKDINIQLAFYNFLASKIIDTIRTKNNQSYLNNIINLKDKINSELSEVEEKILYQLNNNLLSKKLKLIAKNYFIKNGRLIRDKNKNIFFPKIKFNHKNIKIKFIPINYMGYIKGKCVIINGEETIPKSKGAILITKDLNNHLIPFIENSKALIIERGAKKTLLTKILKEKNITLIQIPMATTIFTTGNIIEIEDKFVKVLK